MASQSMPRPSDRRTPVNTKDGSLHLPRAHTGFDGERRIFQAGTRTHKTCRDLKLGRGLTGPNPEARRVGWRDLPVGLGRSGLP